MLWAPRPANYNIDKNNPDLVGMTPFQVFEEVIRRMGQRGMKVILDRHRPNASGQSDLWYTDAYPETKWIEDWVYLAQYFKGNPAVIGADLHNEPNGDATWGWEQTATDWDLAAERCGNAILAVNSDWLIVVEGTAANAAGIAGHYWAGGNLKGVTKAPVELSVPNKLVYSTHDYGPEIYDKHSWFTDASFPTNLPATFDEYWGFIAKNNLAPILVGEFGIKDVTNTAALQWIQGLIAYMKANGIYWTYWTWSPDSSDTGGILANDWNTAQQDKMNLLNVL
jgi:endoglucanase